MCTIYLYLCLIRIGRWKEQVHDSPRSGLIASQIENLRSNLRVAKEASDGPYLISLYIYLLYIYLTPVKTQLLQHVTFLEI